MITQPSPNFNDRPKGIKIKYLILHYTGMATGEAALERLCDDRAKVSAHYLVEEDGRVYSLVPESKRAWHAGVASWEGDRDINGLSIGIELVNPGHDAPEYKGNYRPFPEAQMMALAELAKDILSRHKIVPWHILGHSDVAPNRKCDPGELFEWKWLASEGVGLWPKVIKDMSSGEALSIQEKLTKYGYVIESNGDIDQQIRNVICAFQRHFRPTDISGTFDQECHAILESLLGARDY